MLMLIRILLSLSSFNILIFRLKPNLSIVLLFLLCSWNLSTSNVVAP